MTMTTISKSSNISNQAHSSFSLFAYERKMFITAMNFLKNNNIYLYDEAFSDIKKFFIEDLFKKKASLDDMYEVAASIDNYFVYNKDKFKANTRKVMIQKIEDLFSFCIDIIRDFSMNGKKSTSKRTIDDFYKSFLEDVDKRKNCLHNIDEVDVLYSMFCEMLKCYFEGGDFHMIDALDDKLGEYLEANYED